jgi:hypothetical protein
MKIKMSGIKKEKKQIKKTTPPEEGVVLFRVEFVGFTSQRRNRSLPAGS